MLSTTFDPENRLVADELERRWNQALERVQELQLQLEQHARPQDAVAIPSPEEFQDLAASLEAVWNATIADMRVKKRIVRTLIREIVVDVDANAGEVILVIHWKGGVHTELRLPRRRRGQNSSQTSQEVVGGVKVLARICSDDLIAGVLNRNSLLTGRGNRWTRERVAALRSHHGIAPYCAAQANSDDWMNLTRAASFLGISGRTLRLAVERGEIKAQHPFRDGPWVFNRSELQSQAATELAKRVNAGGRNPAVHPSQQAILEFSST